MTRNEESYYWIKALKERAKQWNIPKRGQKAFDDALICMKTIIDKEYEVKIKVLQETDERRDKKWKKCQN